MGWNGLKCGSKSYIFHLFVQLLSQRVTVTLHFPCRRKDKWKFTIYRYRMLLKINLIRSCFQLKVVTKNFFFFEKNLNDRSLIFGMSPRNKFSYPFNRISFLTSGDSIWTPSYPFSFNIRFRSFHLFIFFLLFGSFSFMRHAEKTR